MERIDPSEFVRRLRQAKEHFFDTQSVSVVQPVYGDSSYNRRAPENHREAERLIKEHAAGIVLEDHSLDYEEFTELLHRDQINTNGPAANWFAKELRQKIHFEGDLNVVIQYDVNAYLAHTPVDGNNIKIWLVFEREQDGLLFQQSSLSQLLTK